MDRPDILANIADIRRQEMDRAREILGIRQVWLGFVDSGLPEGDDPPPLPDGCFARIEVSVAAAPLVKIIRSFRPHVMTTYNESDGGYRHPDHVMCHKISIAAFAAASDPDAYPDLGAAWQPLSSITRLPSIASGRWHWIGRWWHGASNRRTPSASVIGLRIRSRRRASLRGLTVPAISMSVTAPSSRTRPRSIQTDRGLRCRSRCTNRPGQPRNGSSCAAWLIRASPRTICSQESPSRWRVEFQHESSRRRHDPSGRRPECGPGWAALIVVLLLGIAMVFLYLSMRKQFRKIRGRG